MAAESIILKAPGASGAEIELAGLAGFDATATDFSGSGQYVSTTYAVSPVGSARTYMGWASRDTTSGYHCLFATSGASPVQLWITNGNQDVSFAADGTSFNTWTNVWPGLDQWVHWALAFDDVANTVSLYINGLLMGTQSSTVAPNAAAGNLRWGARGVTPDIPFNGKLAWVSVHERILTATEIARCANPADYATAVKALSNLGQLLPLTATGGVTDQSTNARNGTAAGSPTVGGYSPGPVSNWTTQGFDLGNPPDASEWIESDADGSVPVRKPFKGNREISHTIRVGSQVAPGAFKEMIGRIDQFFENAKITAAAGVSDPINYYRVVYTPKDSTHSFFLPVFGGGVTSVPKEIDGDSSGWFTGTPQITYEAICDATGYGPQVTYLDATTAAAPAVSVTVPGGNGDTSPWIKTMFKDVAAVTRGMLIAGVKKNEASTTATILASAMTPAAATYSAPNLVSSATDPSWLVMGTTARQTRTGRFRVYAHRVVSASWTGKIALRWSEANSAVQPRYAVSCGAGLNDLFLGEVNANVAWDMWIESSLDVSFYALILVPVDSFLQATTAAPGKQMVGAAVASDALQSTSTHIGGRAMTVGGSWSTVNSASPTWPVSAANWARRSATPSSPALAIAGTANYMDHQVKATIRVSDIWSSPGVFLRCDGTASNLLYAQLEQSSAGQSQRFVVRAKVAGVNNVLGVSASVPFDLSMYGNYLTLALQATSDGRWYCELVETTPAGVVVGSVSASGANALLVSGSTLGVVANAKAGIWDYQSDPTATNRDFANFSVAPLLGVTPPPIGSGATTTLRGPILSNADGAEQPYIGSSGLELAPGVNNNLTVIAERSANGHASTALADTPALDLDIVGYPRFISVPH